MLQNCSNEDYRVYTLLGDGEIQEGQVWEAAMFAGFRKLDNLVVIVDNNGPSDRWRQLQMYAPRIRSTRNLKRSISM